MKENQTAIGSIIITKYGPGHSEILDQTTGRHAQIEALTVIYTRSDLSERTEHYDTLEEAERAALRFAAKK